MHGAIAEDARAEMCESGHRTNHKSPTVQYLANSSIRGFESPIGPSKNHGATVSNRHEQNTRI